jgi:hypothetical protein
MKAPKEARVEVRELEQERLPAPPSSATTTTDRPVPEDTRRTIAAVLTRAIREGRS